MKDRTKGAEMPGDSETDLKELRALLGLPEPEPDEPTPFALRVASVLAEAVAALRKAGVIEVEDANVDAVAAEVTRVALESSSTKKLGLRIVKTLIHSDLLEEVYGTDEEIQAALQPFLDGL